MKPPSTDIALLTYRIVAQAGCLDLARCIDLESRENAGLPVEHPQRFLEEVLRAERARRENLEADVGWRPNEPSSEKSFRCRCGACAADPHCYCYC